METAMSVINYNPTTKEQIASFTEKLVSEVESGAINALELHVKLTAIESCFKQVKERIKSSVMNEVNVYTEKSFEQFGAKIEKSELGVKYDYSTCNDPIYNRLVASSKVIEAKMKSREPLLKSVPSVTPVYDDAGEVISMQGGLEIIDDETGELIRIQPPLKTSTSGIKVTLK